MRKNNSLLAYNMVLLGPGYFGLFVVLREALEVSVEFLNLLLVRHRRLIANPVLVLK
jgi:hypothetical protein